MKNTIKYMALLALGLVACEPEFDNSVKDNDGFYSNGSADFSTYVALGNSLTAGFADNALYIQGQKNSYPNILATQFKHVGGGEFTQPLMNDNLGGLLLNGNQIQGTRLILELGEDGAPSPVNIPGNPTTDITNTLSGPFNNMGVPGAKSFHLVAPGYGNVAGVATGQANPYFARFRSSKDATVLEDALTQNPTFFSLWIGNNDVLSFATSGGVGVDRTGDSTLPENYGGNDITNPQVFAQVFSSQVEVLTESASGGVVLNIPNVTDTPFFNRVPYNPITPAALEGQLETLNATYAQLNQAFAFLQVPERSIQFSATGASGVVVRDESLADISAQLTQVLIGAGLDAQTATIYGMQYGQARQSNSSDLILLTSSSVIGEVNTARVQELMALGVPQATAGQLAVNGVTYPLEDQYVLISEEQEMVAQATATFNATIKSVAEANDLAFVDANALLAQLANGGVVYDGGMVTAEFATGGAFSLDGIHLTPRGYAIMANKIIEAVNSQYNATVPRVNVGDYNGSPSIGSGIQ
ncbi:G-D-S-L family lipolytic protein [Mesonia aestuariivivens]|uniref:G-D-S-L family lipolytic protein n=1 Tax=Mesonia aestuariivivens TaxID=2796128 RepID=A0ABS6W3M0_9FLAO|nr:G-D-S-L family lipolytic protein [Mesonia aestuariivivens]MBW2962409.1 G-D-S-L family lipolytic protein [Mesonia aestuariivivens]